MTKVEIIKELLGDNMAEIIASDLEEAMEDIRSHMDNIGDVTPMFSYKEDAELKYLLELYDAFEKVLSYYEV